MEKKNWWKEHTETIVVVCTILGTFVVGMVWIDSKFDRIYDRFDKVNERFTQVDTRLTQVEKDIVVMKTILQMKNIMTTEMAKSEKDERKLIKSE